MQSQSFGRSHACCVFRTLGQVISPSFLLAEQHLLLHHRTSISISTVRIGKCVDNIRDTSSVTSRWALVDNRRGNSNWWVPNQASQAENHVIAHRWQAAYNDSNRPFISLTPHIASHSISVYVWTDPLLNAHLSCIDRRAYCSIQTGGWFVWRSC